VTHHDAAAAERSPEEVRADHAAIDRLADELLPALVAKLGASGLGELDVREGSWRVRLRMPGDARGARRSAPGARAAGRPDLHPAAGHAAGGGATHAAGGRAPGTPHPGAADSATGLDPLPAETPTRAVATSPAVGFFRPRTDLPAGARVRAGDRLGTIDVLGVPQELVAPVDGLVGSTFVEPGDPVEYGQDVVEIELLATPAAHAEGG
jgi:biotin carboxyl carrier protein